MITPEQEAWLRLLKWQSGGPERHIGVENTPQGGRLVLRFNSLRTSFGFDMGTLPVEAVTAFLDKWTATSSSPPPVTTSCLMTPSVAIREG